MFKALIILSIAVPTISLAEEWMQVADGEGSAVECADVLVLEKLAYRIRNDCYGDNPANPVIESGAFKIIGNQISFGSRKVVQPSFLQTGSDDKTLEIRNLGNGRIELVDGNKIYFFKIEE
jgi:hypothetical protein